MMSETPRFDLVEIVKTLQSRRLFILMLTLLIVIGGAAAWLLGTRKYKSSAAVLVANPFYTDRNNIFRNEKAVFVEYFGKEDDIDKVLAVAKSDQTKGVIANQMELAKIYKYDTSKEEDRTALSVRFNKSFDVKRTEYQNVEISYTDPDPKLAMNVANNAVRIIDEIYTGYFNSMRTGARNSLKIRLKQADSMISSMTDTLANLRDRYHIYDIISPARQEMVSGSMKSGGGPGYGHAMEEIQNIEATKDQMVSDRARYVSLISEFSAGQDPSETAQIQVISPASIPDKPTGLSLPLTLLVFLLAGGFFACLWALLDAYFKALIAVKR